MNIYEFLHTPVLVTPRPVPTGHASTPEELLKTCIPVDLTDKKLVNSIIEWHNLLLRYINNNPDPVFLSRLYESAGISGAWDTRRGALTICKNYRYAFASNHFARIIYTMAINCFIPTDDDFSDMMNNMKFSLFYEHRLTPIEKKIAAYTNIPYDHPYYTPDWYLAHIISVNDCPYFNHEHIPIRDIFQIGNASDWVYNSKIDRMVRTNDVALTPEEYEVAKAHFIRFVDPINYFLVPGKNFVVYNKQHEDDGAPLGENKYVLDLMTLEASRAFGKTFEEFMKEALVDPDYIKTIKNRYKVNQTIDAHYSTVQFTKSERDAKTVKLKKSKIIKTKAIASGATASSSAAKNDNKPIVFGILNDMIARGLMTATMLKDLMDPEFAKRTFSISIYPFLVKETDFVKTGYSSKKFYRASANITINGEEYRVCSQWIPARIVKLKAWYSAL